MIDERYVQAYTKWIKSATTRAVLEKAREALLSVVHEMGDDDLVTSAKSHWYRKGGESVLNMLEKQITADQVEKFRQQNTEPDYGAEQTVMEDLFEQEG